MQEYNAYSTFSDGRRPVHLYVKVMNMIRAPPLRLRRKSRSVEVLFSSAHVSHYEHVLKILYRSFFLAQKTPHKNEKGTLWSLGSNSMTGWTVKNRSTHHHTASTKTFINGFNHDQQGKGITTTLEFVGQISLSDSVYSHILLNLSIHPFFHLSMHSDLFQWSYAFIWTNHWTNYVMASVSQYICAAVQMSTSVLTIWSIQESQKYIQIYTPVCSFTLPSFLIKLPACLHSWLATAYLLRSHFCIKKSRFCEINRTSDEESSPAITE